MDTDTNVTPTYITLGEAAKRTGLSKATISRMIRKGRISAKEKGEDGAFRIDPAEIIRFMDAARVQRATVQAENEDTNVTHSKDTELSSETAIATRLRELREHDALEVRATLAEARLADLKAQLEVMKEQFGDMKQQRDGWQQQAERALLLQKQPEPAPPPERGWFAKWFKKAG